MKDLNELNINDFLAELKALEGQIIDYGFLESINASLSDLKKILNDAVESGTNQENMEKINQKSRQLKSDMGEEYHLYLTRGYNKGQIDGYFDTLEAAQNQIKSTSVTAQDEQSQDSENDKQKAEYHTCLLALNVGEKVFEIDQITPEHSQQIIDLYQSASQNQTNPSETLEFESFEAFQRSDYFKNLDASQREKYAENNYPGKITKLTFANMDEATAFLKSLEDSNLIKEGTSLKTSYQLSDSFNISSHKSIFFDSTETDLGSQENKLEQIDIEENFEIISDEEVAELYGPELVYNRSKT